MRANKLLVNIEGLPGSGKTTQSRMLATRLILEGISASYVSDLGTSSRTGLSRRLLGFFSASGDLFMRSGDPVFDCFLAAAIKACDVAEIIEPALEVNQVVIEDRGCNTMYSYGLASFECDDLSQYDKTVKWLRSIDEYGGIRPDVVILLDIPLETAVARFERREGRVLTPEEKDYLLKVSRAYDYLASIDDQIIRVNCDSKTPNAVHDEIYRVIKRCLEEGCNSPVGEDAKQFEDQGNKLRSVGDHFRPGRPSGRR